MKKYIYVMSSIVVYSTFMQGGAGLLSIRFNAHFAAIMQAIKEGNATRLAKNLEDLAQDSTRAVNSVLSTDPRALPMMRDITLQALVQPGQGIYSRLSRLNVNPENFSLFIALWSNKQLLIDLLRLTAGNEEPDIRSLVCFFAYRFIIAQALQASLKGLSYYKVLKERIDQLFVTDKKLHDNLILFLEQNIRPVISADMLSVLDEQQREAYVGLVLKYLILLLADQETRRQMLESFLTDLCTCSPKYQGIPVQRVQKVIKHALGQAAEVPRTSEQEEPTQAAEKNIGTLLQQLHTTLHVLAQQVVEVT